MTSNRDLTKEGYQSVITYAPISKKTFQKTGSEKLRFKKICRVLPPPLDKYGEKNKRLTDEIRKELSALWNKL